MIEAIPQAVEQWREIVRAECSDVPEDIILGVINRESAGVVGRVAGKTTKYGFTNEEMACGFDSKLNYRALGLMQIVPRTLRDYNQRNPKRKVTPCQLVGKTKSDARAQIRVGVSVFKQGLHFAHNIAPKRNPWPHGKVSKEQVLIADLVYTRGAGNVRAMLDKCIEQGLPQTYKSIKSIAGNWGTTETPFKHAEAVLAYYDPTAEKKKSIA